MIVGKDEAAAWMLDRLRKDLRPPLEHARAVYLAEQDASYEHLPTPANRRRSISPPSSEDSGSSPDGEGDAATVRNGSATGGATPRAWLI